MSQLRGRVGNSHLESVAAFVKDYTRIFAGDFQGWGGAVATLVPCLSQITYGSLVYLSKEELDILSAYEGPRYTLREVEIYTAEDSSIQGFMYVMTDPVYLNKWPPASYLTACFCQLRDTLPDLQSLEVQTIKSDASLLVLQNAWSPPSALEMDLPSFLVLVNNHPSKSEVWIMPRAIQGIVNALAAIDITTTATLAKRLCFDDSMLMEQLRRNEVEVEAFSVNTLAVMRAILMNMENTCILDD